MYEVDNDISYRYFYPDKSDKLFSEDINGWNMTQTVLHESQNYYDGECIHLRKKGMIEYKKYYSMGYEVKYDDYIKQKKTQL